MKNILYCAHCAGALMHRNINEKDIYFCPMCAAVYEKTENGFKYVANLSGGAAIKETVDLIDAINRNEDANA